MTVNQEWEPSVDVFLKNISQVLPKDCLENDEIFDVFVNTLITMDAIPKSPLPKTTSLARALHASQCVYFQRQEIINPPMVDYSHFSTLGMFCIFLGLLQHTIPDTSDPMARIPKSQR